MKTDRIRGRPLQRILKRIRRRDNGLCQDCLALGFTIPGVEVDHTVPLWKGGEETDENRRLLCVEHHATKTRADMSSKPKGADLDGMPTDPRHPWNIAKESA